MNKKSFAHLLTEKELENILDLKKFFIVNEVYIPFSYETYIEFDEGLYQFLTKNEAQKQREEAKKPLVTDSFKFNPDLIDQIYNGFLTEKKRYIDDYVGYKADNIKMLLKLAHNQERRKEIIEKHLKICAKKIAKTDLSEDLFSRENKIDLISESSKNLIKNSISLKVDAEIIIDYLTHGYQMSYFEHDLFKEYYEIDFYQRLIKKPKEISSKINKESLTNPKEDIDKLDKMQKSKYPLVFKSLEGENLLKEFLEINTGVNEKHQPIERRFKPMCEAFYEAAHEYISKTSTEKYQVFIPSVNKKDYIEMLIEEYKINSITKLSSGSSYIDLASKFISEVISEQSRTK